MPYHRLAGQTVTLNPATDDPIQGRVLAGARFQIEDYFTVISEGLTVQQAADHGNWAARNYIARAEATGLPVDDDVLYGKIDGLGYIVHPTEL